MFEVQDKTNAYTSARCAKRNKNEITFLWVDRDRDFKEDWEWKKIKTKSLDCYIWKKFTLQRFAKKIQKYLIGNKSFGKDQFIKDLNRKYMIGKDWVNKACIWKVCIVLERIGLENSRRKWLDRNLLEKIKLNY